MSAEERKKHGRRGPANSRWQGGLRHKDGYVYIGPGNGIKRSHVVWGAIHPEDPILPDQIIHHLNHVKDDDRPENLAKLPSQSAHATHHGATHMHTPERIAKRAATRRRNTEARYGGLPPCERCGMLLTHRQMLEKGRFCSPACAYAFSTGKPRSGW